MNQIADPPLKHRLIAGAELRQQAKAIIKAKIESLRRREPNPFAESLALRKERSRLRVIEQLDA